MSLNKEYVLLYDLLHVYRKVTYEKMMNMFYKFKTGIIFVGGPWCKNCQAVAGIINKVAKKNKIRTIQHYDPKFTNIFKEDVDLRDCGDLETKLNYYYLIEKIGYTSDELVQDTLMPRLKVPAVIGVRNGVCVGVIDDEYILDENGLHENDSSVDKSNDYIDKLTELFKKVKSKISL